VALADRSDGDIDTLSNRIAHVRTWTFAANRPDWLADPEHWQGVTRAVEDKLSDALHERLSERFIDRRTSVLMRRLRENTTLETEIGKTGEVTVEGHVIGRLDGFMFAPDASAGGSEAKALNAAAQKALASEIESRATKLSQAPNEQIVLANDGALRWQGDVVGKLVAGDEVLRPRLRIVADEHLTGPSRELVQNRLDLWLKNHIEKLLAPLFSLSAAEDVTGMARGVAFQLVEALGVLERQKVSEEVKGLDQPSRATLRKYGVRFGAYHIYLPLLLKPAPRSLATQLWALKHESPQAKGLTDLLHLAASGRTSIPVESETPKPLYRTAGYRVCGERAVRVDILERLADLIRPALAWREGSTGQKPAGAFDGRGFTVTGAMTSLTGASGEDFSSILRSLGYRLDRRPKPAEPAAPAAETAPAIGADAPQAETNGEAKAESGAEVAEPPVADNAEAVVAAAPVAAAVPDVVPARVKNSLSLLPSTDFFPEAIAPIAPPEQPAAVEAVAPEVTNIEPAPVAEALAPIAEAVETAPAADRPAQAATESATPAPAEPAFIDVWRLGGRSERRPHQKRPPRRERSAQPHGSQQAAQPAAPQAAQAFDAAPAAESVVASAETTVEQKDRRQQRSRNFRPRVEGGEKPADRNGRNERPGQNRRDQNNDRSDRKFSKPGRRDRGASVDRAERDLYYAKPGARSRPSKEADPNSPFAKLAALKQQLEDNAKERH
jgi:ATP-dependent RNA helicase SUPV3L1/SUV3